MKNYFLCVLFLIPVLCIAQPLRYPPVQHDEKFSGLGYYYPLYIANRIPYIDVYTDGIKGTEDSIWRASFLVDYGTDTTVVDLKGFPGTRLDISKDHRYSLKFKDGPWKNPIISGPYTPPFCYEQSLGGFMANGIREGGIIGTDILSQIVLTLDYKYSRFYIANDKSWQSTPQVLNQLGFIPASTKGYFSNDRSNLIWKTINKDLQESNNPYVQIVIGVDKDTAQALGSIDPGYDDRIYLMNDFNTYYTHVININQQYYEHLRKKGIVVNINRKSYATLDNRAPNPPDTLFKCSFEKKQIFSMISTEGKYIYPYSTDSITVFLKVNGKGGESAGGITTLPFPAAQFGGSFLLDFDMVTFDPFRSLVWFLIPK